MSSSLSVIMLFVIIIVITAAATIPHSTSAQTLPNTLALEFKRAYFNSSRDEPVRASSYLPLYVRTPYSTTWLNVCSLAGGSITTTAKTICGMMGFSGYGADFYRSSSFSTFPVYGVSSLGCFSRSSSSSQSDDDADFSQCSVSSTQMSCEDWSFGRRTYSWYTLRCSYSSTSSTDGSRGIFVPAKSADMFVRRRVNGQMQLRQIFTTKWRNIAASSSSHFSADAATSLCRWITGSNEDASAWSYMSYVSSSSSVLDSANGFAIKDLSCDNSSGNPKHCTYSTDGLSSLPSSKAVAFTCELSSTDKGVPIGDGYFLRLQPLSSSGQTFQVQIVDSSASAQVRPQVICADSNRSRRDSDTVSALCRWAQYGPNAYGVSGRFFSSYYSAIWQSISCPAGGSSIGQCKVSTTGYCGTGPQYLSISCFQGSPDGSSSSSSSSSSFPILAVVLPVCFFVIIMLAGLALWLGRDHPALRPIISGALEFFNHSKKIVDKHQRKPQSVNNDNDYDSQQLQQLEYQNFSTTDNNKNQTVYFTPMNNAADSEYNPQLQHGTKASQEDTLENHQDTLFPSPSSAPVSVPLSTALHSSASSPPPPTPPSFPEWMSTLSVQDNIKSLLVKEQITEASFSMLDESDLKEMGMPLGPRKYLAQEIQKRQSKPTATTPSE